MQTIPTPELLVTFHRALQAFGGKKFPDIAMPIGRLVALFSIFTVAALAGVLDFDSQGLFGPSAFPGHSGNLEIKLAGGGRITLTGGVILSKTSFLPADQTSVYGTTEQPPMSNPITITFETGDGQPNPITDFFLDVFNGQISGANYRLQDNLGHVATFNLEPNTASGATTIGFPTIGTQVTVTALPLVLPDGTVVSPAWDFLIDNIHFSEPLPSNLPPTLESEDEHGDIDHPVAEPSTLFLLSGAAVCLLFVGRKRLRLRTFLAAFSNRADR